MLSWACNKEIIKSYLVTNASTLMLSTYPSSAIKPVLLTCTKNLVYVKNYKKQTLEKDLLS